MKTPESEILINADLVKSLILCQCSKFSNLPINEFKSGWDNTMFRLGENMLVRIPRREIGAKLMLNESKYLPTIRQKLSVPCPEVIFIGSPQKNYPWVWSINSFLDGENCLVQNFKSENVPIFLEFLRELHEIKQGTPPSSNSRGIPIFNRRSDVFTRLESLGKKTELNISRLKEIFDIGAQCSSNIKKRWIHGDLHPGNVLQKNGLLSGVIDWGDTNFGDRATDLASIWMLFSQSKDRFICLDEYKMDADLLARSKSWAIFFGAVLLDTGLTDTPSFIETGSKTLARILEDS